MEFAAGNGAQTGNDGWWAEESAVSLSHISASDTTLTSTTLAQQYSLLAGVAANISSGFILLNQREHVTYCNPGAVRLLGIYSSDLIEQPRFDLRKQLLSLTLEPELVQPNLDRAWNLPEQETSTDIALTDAAVRWLRVRFFPVRDPLGNLLGRGVLLDDITLERSTLTSRSETLALAAHELKTPLAVIKGCATTLLGNSSHWDPTIQREMLQMIDTQADRLYEVLNTLLDVWRLDSGAQILRVTQVNLPEFLRQLVERWQKNAQHHVFVLNLSHALPILVCDVVRLEHALHALFNNAVTYSPDGGTITIQVLDNASEVLLSISDQGIGIAPEHLDRIFDRFYRIRQEERPGGSGLGLAVARATLEAHGGKIWADSPGLGQGTTFYCVLPFTPRFSSPVQPHMTAPLPADRLAISPVRSLVSLKSSQRSYILLAEHDTRITRYLRANLEEQHYRVQAINHGQHCLRQFELEEPDLVILSTHLADMSGADLLQRLREFSHIPVIMLCDAHAECDEEARARLLDLGADDLVMQPFSIKEFLARVRASLRRQHGSTAQSTKQAIFTSGDLLIDYAQHLVLLQGSPIQLSRTEYKLLSTLAHNVGMVLTHEVLLERVWGPEYNREVDFIWVYISRLRRKIEADPRHPRYILTIPDVGYKLAKV